MPIQLVPANSPAGGKPSGEAVVRKRADGEFDIVCAKCSQALAVAINERALYWAGGVVLRHRCDDQQHKNSTGLRS
jgi:hypothetical protein